MSNKVLIINAFEPQDVFISHLSRAYESALRARGLEPEFLFVNNMNFSFTPFPDQYTFDTLEFDLQRSVQLIKYASTVAIFTSMNRDNTMPIFQQFTSRLFHLKSGMINKEIWGNINPYGKVLRIITVLNDPDLWKKFHLKRKRSVVPLPKISFGLFGFGQIYSRTFGFLKEDDINNEYAKKSFAAMVNMAEKD